jgi:cellulose synthase/poly-beta-1,6-N-acetylglucosamine synthase-like glycosyltransferase
MDKNAQDNLPMGLAGNSFYVRTNLIREVGGWDPYNVTEDADLTVRLIRKGIQFVRLDSETNEPCPDTFGNWIKQRTRWNKGLMMTKMIHLSKPGFGFRELDRRQWGAFWGRMFCGSLVPLGVFHSLVLGTYFKHFGGSDITDIINYILAANFVISLGVSMTSDYIHFKKMNMKVPLYELLIGTLMYWTLYLYSGFLAYWEYIKAPLQWNKTDHDNFKAIASTSRTGVSTMEPSFDSV